MTKHHKHRERRRHRRIRKPAIVRFHVKSEEHPVKHHSEWNMGAVLNIGAGGLLFYYDKKVDVDSLLHLKIYLHNPETSINCIGKVIRVEEIPHMNLVAVIYTEIEEKDKNMLKDMSKDFHQESTND